MTDGGILTTFGRAKAKIQGVTDARPSLPKSQPSILCRRATPEPGTGDRLLSREGDCNKTSTNALCRYFSWGKLSSGEKKGCKPRTAGPQECEGKMLEWWCSASGQNRRTQKTPCSQSIPYSTRWGGSVWLQLTCRKNSLYSLLRAVVELVPLQKKRFRSQCATAPFRSS